MTSLDGTRQAELEEIVERRLSVVEYLGEERRRPELALTDQPAGGLDLPASWPPDTPAGGEARAVASGV